MLRKLLMILALVCMVPALLAACATGAAVVVLPTLTPTAILPIATVLPAVTSTPTLEPGISSLAEALPMYQYDQKKPFDLKVVSEEVRDGVSIQNITYPAADPQFTSDSHGRIEAYLVVPAGKGPFAGILFAHGLGSGWGTRKEFLDDAVSLAQQGVVSLLPSGVFPWAVTFKGTAAEDQMSVIQQVRELRRAVDLLLAQPGVDAKRIAFVGHDYGAMHGAVLAGVEKRIKAYVLMAGDTNYSSWAIQYFIAPVNVAGYRKLMAVVDPTSYLPEAAPAELYFQFGKSDQFIDQETANQLFDSASQPKKVDWYAAGHTLNAQAAQDRLAWLAGQLGLPAVQK